MNQHLNNSFWNNTHKIVSKHTLSVNFADSYGTRISLNLLPGNKR